EGDLLFFAFDIGLADGAQLNGLADGVRFEVELDGQKVFAKDWRECRWQAQVVDLAPLAGRRVVLTLLTGAIKNTSYDWAVWGNPRVLRFRGLSEFKSNASGHVSIPIPSGALALQCGATNDLKVFLKSDDTAARVEWPVSLSASGNPAVGWAVRDFNFPNARKVTLEWEPPDVPVTLFAASYAPLVKLSLVSATRAVVSVEER